MNVNPSRVPGADRADDIKSIARGHIAAVRSNDRLSAAGKAEQIRSVYDQTQKALADLRAELEREPRRQRDSLELMLFGHTAAGSATDAISARDAYERASQISSHDEAQRLMETARLSSDTVLAKAVAQVAVTHEWTDVLETYADGDTFAEERFTKLLHLNAQLADTGTETVRLAAEMEKQLVFTLEQPDELSRPVFPEVAEHHHAEVGL